LAAGLTPTALLRAALARAGSPTEGREVGIMHNLPRRDGLIIFPPSGDVGAQYSPAAGWAQAIRYRQRVMGEPDWGGAIAVALGGEGSVAANGFWAALNVVTPLHLPMLYFIEDNSFGISVPGELQTPCGNIVANLAAYSDLRVMEGDGTQPAEAWEKIVSAVEYVRCGAGPCLLRLQVVRLKGHTFIDDQAYKTNEVRAAEAERDPLPRLRKYLLEQKLLTSEGWEALVVEVRGEVASALTEAEAAPEPEPSGARRHIFYEGVPPLVGGLRPENALLPLGVSLPRAEGARINLIDAVRRTLESEMEKNPRLLVFGEDVGVKGGVHGATLDMQKHFGAERVFDTSLSEDGIVGRAVGMALAGLLPAPEIQFRKYADPAHEQITDLGWLRWRSAGRFAAPLVLRIPLGFGKKVGDPWHSVSGEAIFAHLIGWRIAFPSNAEDAVGLLRTALRGDDPTFFLEHRALLDTPESRRPYPGDDYSLPFGRAALLRAGHELTVVTWGAMVYRCLEAAQEFSGRIAILDLRTIIPWDREAVIESVRKTGKALVVHEDTLTNGFGAEIAATIAAEAFTDLDAPVQRLATPDVPVPYSIPLMNAIVPTVEQIREKMVEILAF
jgi:2-oxoisovalerate dehydrogenase E1 component